MNNPYELIIARGQSSGPPLVLVVEEINNRPRKVLAYKTANEVYSEQISKLTGVRIPARI